jgi:hypothetical protein
MRIGFVVVFFKNLPAGFFGFGDRVFVFESDFYLNNPGISLMRKNDIATSFVGLQFAENDYAASLKKCQNRRSVEPFLRCQLVSIVGSPAKPCVSHNDEEADRPQV